MRKIMIAFLALVLLAPAPALAVDTMHAANQAVVAWNPVDNATAYEIYTRPLAGGDAVKVGETDQTSYTLTFTSDAQVVVGVAAIRRETVNGVPTIVGQSAIVWSDDAKACAAPGTFGLYYYVPPGTVAGLRLQQ